MKKIFIKIFFIILAFYCAPSFAEQKETLIILDASASMLEPFESTPKYILAVDEVKKVLNSFPKSEKIGLRTIGISMGNAINFLGSTDGFCKATSLVAPIKNDNIDTINGKLDLLFPLGTTPLKYSLEKAINDDFSQYSFKHIILITDGGESCEEDPCGYIQEIMRQRSDIKIDVIGIGVSNDELTELDCIAGSTAGKVYNVNTPIEFTDALNKFFKVNNLPDESVPFIKHDIQDKEQIIYKNYLLEE